MHARFQVTKFKPAAPEHCDAVEDVHVNDIRGVTKSEVAAAKADARDGACAEVVAADGTIYQITSVDADGYQVN